MAKSRLQKLYRSLLSTLSFSSELRKMRRELNAKIDQPESIVPPPPFHPQGVNRWFKRRRITIGETYLRVVRDLDSRHSSARLDALRQLADVAFHSSNIDYPLNTARVQTALIKETVKHRSSKRRQLELLYDFSMSTRGQHQVIRRLCDELNIIELPEKSMRLGDFDYGWDDHVHDTATTGRKNPTQLVLDAFIKGISSLTIAYGSVSDIDMIEEALEAGAILGIRVNIALEFSAMIEGDRYHFMAVLPPCANGREVRAFFADHAQDLGFFFAGLDQNRENKFDAARRLLDAFNRDTLPIINMGFEDKPEFCLAPLSLEELLATIPNMNLTLLHLAEYLYLRYRPILQKRLWYCKVLREKEKKDGRRGSPEQAGAESAESLYSRTKKELKNLDTDSIMSTYFSEAHAIAYKTVFEDIETLSAMLRAAGCIIKFIHPLEYGIETARRVFERCCCCIDQVEVYNTQNYAGHDIEPIIAFARLVNEYNRRASAEGRKPIEPVCGSDATGRTPKIPGMGFIFEDQLIGKFASRYIKRHMQLPALVSAMVRAKGTPVDEPALIKKPVPRIISMGKYTSGEGSGGDDELIGPLRAWRYFNPTFKNLVRTCIGYAVASSIVGPWYAVLWLGITGFRNSIADLVSSRGTRLNQWTLKSINFDNVAQSLFWTGFSVPILGFVKANFDLLWPWAHAGFLFEMVKFFFISFANGLYLATHNTLRGFDRSVVKANFFRSVLAWPLATVFAPVGNALAIPSIVQTKIWSDVVAGFIEGGNNYIKVVRQRQKVLEEIIPAIIHSKGSAQCIAMLDILYLFSQEPRTQSSIKAVLSPYVLFTRKLKKNSSLRLNLLVELHRTMCQDWVWTELAHYIIANYDEEMADDLISLVVDALPEFQDWLAALITKYGESTGLLARFGIERK